MAILSKLKIQVSKKNRMAGGHDLLTNVVNAGVYLVGMAAAKTQLNRQGSVTIRAEIDAYLLQAEENDIHTILTTFHAYRNVQDVAALPPDGTNRTHKRVPKSMAALCQHSAKDEPANLEQILRREFYREQVAYLQNHFDELTSSGMPKLRNTEARCLLTWASNRQQSLLHGTSCFDTSATRRAERLTPAGYMILWAGSMGLPPPGSHLYTGTFCRTCRVTCDAWHAYTCKTHGRSFEHEGFMDKIVDQLTHSRLRVTAREPRGKHYYNGASGKGGPDATFVHPDGAVTHVDASGINPYSHTHQQRAAREIATEAQTNFLLAGIFTPQQVASRACDHPGMSSIDHRDWTKNTGHDALVARKHGDAFLPLSYSLAGGISKQVSSMLSQAFPDRPGSSYEARWKHASRSMQQVAQKGLSVAIVNSTGAHMIRTIKTLLKASPHIPPLTDLNLWRPWMPPRPCLDPSSIPHEHFPSPYSYAGDASDDAPVYYPDA